MSFQKFNPAISSTIAIHDADGKYMKVTLTNGLEFTSMDFDDNAIFIVVPHSSGKIALVSHNEKYMNMYYLDDIKCEGPGGLDVSVTFLDDYFVQFGILGFKGQDEKMYYVSCEPGNASYHGSLAVKKEQDCSTFFVIEPIGKATLTGTVALKDMNGKFMSVTSTNGLTFDKTFVEENAIFKAQASGSTSANRAANEHG
ncbi:hypothetical protein Moror_13456 [Moniliophthora roreri MCA 2997]|uniref:Fascin domain-containing protein n=1 Tax=Moniliophthora roreri (strain MCA 2997) TaxID=1381753 RepID=V2WP59_MONRO|nr:hypothetical protein Moror_13456 [Moniliophthora roreri MCA 2997]